MRIILAQKHGMCFGVRRALNLACGTAGFGRVLTYGPLVHNSDVVKDLNSKGISVAEISCIQSGDTVIIRAHGISDKEFAAIKQKGARIIDATCPFVAKAKRAAKKMEEEGCKVIIFGQKDHPEVRGIAESIESPVVVSSADDLKSYSFRTSGFRRLGLVSQTTQPEQKFAKISEIVKSMDPDAEIVNTICHATQERQESAKETARESDLMIVIGGYDSANTKKLAELCSEITETRHIERASEIECSWFKDKAAVGITAGASTPETIIRRVLDQIRGFDNEDIKIHGDCGPRH